MQKIALVIGVTGGLGSEVAKSLLAQGWSVRGLARDPIAAKKRFPELASIEWCAGDAMRQRDVSAAASGASLIFHGANPPGYKNWRGLAIPMLAHSVTAAKATGARLILPGNLYNFGRDADWLLREDTPQRPTSRKGAIRVEMEEMLHGVRSLVIRTGDFFGPHAPGSWFSNMLVKSGRPLSKITYPERSATGHTWAYLPDIADAIARLAAIEAQLAETEVVNFRGHWLEDGREMVQAIRRAAGRPDLPVNAFPWWLLYLSAPVYDLSRQVLEMRYLWQRPFALDNTKLISLIGAEPHTPLDEAVLVTLRGLGCLPDPEPDSRVVAQRVSAP
jgi:nucleoside-diphosphate-sugar epimerase